MQKKVGLLAANLNLLGLLYISKIIGYRLNLRLGLFNARDKTEKSRIGTKRTLI